MSLVDLINQFALNIDKINSSNKNESFSNDHFIKLFNTNYNSAIKLAKRLELSALENLNSTSELLSNYNKYIEDTEESLKRQVKEFNDIREYNTSILDDTLLNKEHDIIELTKGTNEKSFVLESKARDRINSFDIDKNLQILDLKNRIPDLTAKYNETKKFELTKKDIKISQIHAKVSKELHSYKQANNSILDENKKELLQVNSKIDILNQEIDNFRSAAESAILKLNIEHNKIVDKINKQHQTEAHMNNVQTQMLIDGYNQDEKHIKEEFDKKKQEILKENQFEFAKLDKEIDEAVIIQANTMSSLKHKQAYERIYLELKLNKVLASSLLDTNKVMKAKIKVQRTALQKEYDFLVKKHSKQIKELEKKQANEMTILKNKRYALDYKRRFLVNVESINERIELFKIAKNIEISHTEKLAYNRIIENNYSKEINIKRNKTDDEISSVRYINKGQELEIQNKIEDCRNKLDAIKGDIKLCEALEKIISAEFEDNDESLKRIDDIKAILEIEKNKFLLSYNNELINLGIKRIDVNHSYNVKKENAGLGYEKRKLQEELNYQMKSLENLRELTKIKKTIEEEKCDSDIALLNYYNQFDVIKSKNNVQAKKQELDAKYTSKVIETTQSLLSIFHESIFNFTTIVVDHVKYHLTNSEGLIRYINRIANEYLNFFNNIFLYAKRILVKTIDSRITFEISTKYDKLLEDSRNAYALKRKQIVNKEDSVKETISNYKSSQKKLYIELRDIEREISSSSKENMKFKALINQRIDLLKRIDDIRDRITLMDKHLKKITPEIIKLNNEEKRVLKKLNKEKDSNLSSNYFMINDINDYTKSLCETLNRIRNPFSFKKLVIYKDTRVQLETFNKWMTITTNEYLIRIKHKLRRYYSLEIEEVKSFNLKNEADYNRNISIMNSAISTKNNNYEHLLNQNSRSFKLETQNHIYKIENITNNYKTFISNNESNYKNSIYDIGDERNLLNDKYRKIFESCDQNLDFSLKRLRARIKFNKTNSERLQQLEYNNERRRKQSSLEASLYEVSKNKEYIKLIPRYKQNDASDALRKYNLLNLKLTKENEDLNLSIITSREQAKLDIEAFTKSSKNDISLLEKRYNSDISKLRLK